PSFADLGQPWLYYTNPEGTVIERATNGGTDGLGPIGDWNAGTRFTELAAGGEDAWDAVLGGPHLEVVDDRLWLFYDGRQPNGAPALGVAIAPDQNLFENADEPFLTADSQPGFAGFEDPAPWHDVSHD